MIGKSIGGYQVVDKLGEGGMGLVYLAEHRELDRRAVVKVLHPHMSGNEMLARRFVNEAKAAASIHHPSIVAIMDAGYHDAGFYYILMEYLEGEALTDRLFREDRMSEATAISFAKQIARALGAAHAKKIVHRDLKPDNIFVIQDPEVAGNERIKILDFGIAKLMENDENVTQSGTLMGSPPYMSPEQCLGATEIDQRTDLYSLGVILFQMISGRLPFERNTTGEYIVAHTTQEPPALRSVFENASVQVEAVISRLLAKDASDRYQSTEELLAALRSTGLAATETSEHARDSVTLNRPVSGFTATSADLHTEVFTSPGRDITSSDDSVVAAAPTVAASPTARSGHRGLLLVTGLVSVAIVGAVGFSLFVGESGKSASEQSRHTPPEAAPPVRANIVHTALEAIAPMPFIGIEAAQFTMGSPGVEVGHDSLEGPRHRVALSGFQIGQYEVTQKQWLAVMDENPSDCAFGCGDDLPVQNVNWHDVTEFANRLSKRHELQPCYQLSDGVVLWQRGCDGYRLPTEAEWEYVARAGTHSPYSFGDDPAQLVHYGWYEANGAKRVHPVGALRANPWGLYDTYGNVWEWVWDGKAEYPSKRATNPVGPRTSPWRILRGGCYLSEARELRSAYRVGLDPNTSYEYLGLRLARGTLDNSPE